MGWYETRGPEASLGESQPAESWKRLAVWRFRHGDVRSGSVALQPTDVLSMPTPSQYKFLYKTSRGGRKLGSITADSATASGF